MKLKLLYTLIGILSFISCKSPGKQAENILSVTIEPQRYFLEQLVGDKYRVNTVVPTGMNPESFDLSPAQILTVNKSKAYFKVGHLGIENTRIQNIIENNKAILKVDCSKGAALIEDHQHDDCDSQEITNHTHPGGLDPHTWSSPATALVMAENMYKAIIRLDSLHIEYYKANYQKLTDEIKQTDSIIRDCLSKASVRAFVIYHPALSYFAKEYNLTQLTVENEGKNPSPVYLKQLIDEAKSEKVKAVFIQQEYDPKNTETVANALGVKTTSINLMSYNWSDEMIKVARAISGENE